LCMIKELLHFFYIIFKKLFLIYLNLLNNILDKYYEITNKIYEF
jgi:hypothetical protein